MPDLLTTYGSSARIGFMGSDSREEYGGTNLRLDYEPLVANGARMVLAKQMGFAELQCYRIATSYPNIARRMLRDMNLNGGSLLRVGGSVEAMPAFQAGVNAVVDIVKSGDTMVANGLEIIAEDKNPIQLGLAWKSLWGTGRTCEDLAIGVKIGVTDKEI